MTNLHPQWQTTDEESPVPIRISSPSVSTELASIPRASRRPAAIVGIMAFLAIGFGLFQGMNGLSGQLAEADETIKILSSGFDPVEITIEPGQTIRWQNMSNVPHILFSETLTIEDDTSFESTIILPTETFDLIVPEDLDTGTFEYGSMTDTQLKGSIIVEEKSIQAVTSSRSSVAAASAASSLAPSISDTPPQASDTADAIPEGSIPVNPYSVGGAVPVQSVTSTPTYVPTNTTTQNTASVTQHTPYSQPSTGMGAWTLGLIGMLALAILLRWSYRNL